MQLKEASLFYDTEPNDQPIDNLLGAQCDKVLVTYLNKRGRVDLVEMSQISGIPCQTLIENLSGKAIIQDPAEFICDTEWDDAKGWMLIAQYCRGNLREKLKLAKNMNKIFHGKFEQNIALIKSILPTPLTLDEIHISLGSPYISAQLITEFLAELLNMKDNPPTVTFNKSLGLWNVDEGDGAISSVPNTLTYGTPRLHATKITENILNNKTTKIYDYFPHASTYERVLNKDATLEAQHKEALIIQEFDRWKVATPIRRTRLEESYNNSLVCYGSSKYDGSFLTFPDLNPDFVLRPNQRNAIATLLLSSENLLFSHDVGTGKTAIISVGCHELYRMGLSKKNMVVCPKGILKTVVNTHKQLYPNDKILAIYARNFTPKYREEVLDKIRFGDYVAIYLAFSSFDMLTMSKSYWVNKMSKDVAAIRNEILHATSPQEKRMLERQRDLLSKKLSKYVLEEVESPFVPFEKLNIDTLFVDEAHCYKNINLTTRADNIVGMHSKGSVKCNEMLEKCHTVKRVVFTTGTPLTNSLADLFVLQTYLQPEELRFRGIDNMDMWLNTFCQRETQFEVDVTGSHLRPVTRFSSFHNLPELMSMFSNVCDFFHLDTSQVKLPTFKGYIDVMVPKSKAQSDFIKDLSDRAEAIRQHLVKRTEDNLLKITTDGHKASLDMRLVDENSPLLPGETDKITCCVQKVMEFYHKYPDTCQVIFSDMGTPKTGFNVYDSLKSKLIKSGIPDHEIAFVHDATSEAARTRLFAEINAGSIRVVIGSTSKLGVGVNMQERLIALHHLSVPWRPADIVQREGRILRQGNTCDEIFILRYITTGSFDAYSWQLLENKQRFISSLLSGESAKRDSDDIADIVLSYAEVKALAIGNPLIKQRVETGIRLDRAKIAHRKRQQRLLELRGIADKVPAEIERLTRLHKTAQLDAALYEQNKEAIPQEERIAFGEELLYALKDNINRDKERYFGDFQGFAVHLPANMDADNPFICIRSSNGGTYCPEIKTDKALGCAMIISHLLRDLHQRVIKYQNEIAITKQKLVDALADIESGNPYEIEVKCLENELEDIDRRLENKENDAA